MGHRVMTPIIVVTALAGVSCTYIHDSRTTNVVEAESTEDGELLEGVNDFGTVGWGGPCPPSGEHTYIFELVALSEPLDYPPTVEGILARAEPGNVAGLSATYTRP